MQQQQTITFTSATQAELEAILGAFSAIYGTTPDHEFVDGTLKLRYNDSFGNGTVEVRRAGLEELQGYRVEPNLWVGFVYHQRGCNFAPRFAVDSVSQAASDLVALYAEAIK